MIRCMKQHLSNILSSIYEKVNTEAELKKRVACKKACNHEFCKILNT